MLPREILEWVAGDRVTRLIAAALPDHPADLVRVVAARIGVSRQAAHRRVKELVDRGLVAAVGSTRSRRYEPVSFALRSREVVPINPKLDENTVYRLLLADCVSALPENVRSIWQYGFTEMVNNARDHSGGRMLRVSVRQSVCATQVELQDDGEGIFRKVSRTLSLDDERYAAFELTTGKFTTDPAHHSGEGIFFASRAFSEFDLFSGGAYLAHARGDGGTWLSGRSVPIDGTLVGLHLENFAPWTMNGVYDQYTAGDDDDFAFDKTVVPLSLAEFEGGQLVSRSQAKRVCARFDRFRRIVLDFEGVPSIGQAFADELFRVFARANPAVELLTMNASRDVLRMIARARAAG